MEHWMAEIMVEMRLHRITQVKLAKQMGVTNEYVCSILNGRLEKVPTGMEQRMRAAIAEICDKEEK